MFGKLEIIIMVHARLPAPVPLELNLERRPEEFLSVCSIRRKMKVKVQSNDFLANQKGQDKDNSRIKLTTVPI